jgi:hypothetical protein
MTVKSFLEKAKEYGDNPSLEESIDRIVTLLMWAKKVNVPPQQFLDHAYDHLSVLKNRTWVKQNDGTYHYI